MGMLRNIDRRIFQVSFTIIGFLVGGILGTIFQEFVTGAISDPLLVMLVILVLVIAVTAMTSVVFKVVIDLSRPKPRVRYFEFPPNHEAGLYNVAARVVRHAREEILATTAPHLEGWPDESDRSGRNAHVKYFRLLLTRSRARNIPYARVLQLREGSALPDHMGSTVFLEHLHDLINERDSDSSKNRLYLSRVPLYRPVTLVLIDSRYLMWEVDERVPVSQQGQSGYVHMRGLLVIEDPTRKLLKPFHVFLSGIALGGTPIDKKDLPPLI